MKSNEIRDFSEEEIEERIALNENEITDLRFKRAVAGLEDPMILRTLRRETARLKTILNEKRRSGSEA